MAKREEEAIKFLVTGGTIDNLEYSSEEEQPKSHNSLIPKMLKQGRATVDYKVEVLMQKDGKFITENDREIIYEACIKAKENQIVITHGTTTIVETAKYLGKRNIDKTIVLVGSLVLGSDKNSDALFNLGTAIIAVKLLPKGVYITMNGKIFSWKNVFKNIKTGKFETIE
jgi:L-asparaginase